MPREEKCKLSITVAGKRLSHCKILEDRAHELLHSVKRLQKQNALLREKEAMQLDMLHSYEHTMEKMSSLLGDLSRETGPNAATGREVLSSVMLAMHSSAQTLLQQVTGSSMDTDPAAGACSRSGNPSSADQKAGSSQRSSKVLGRHTQLAWARVTPEAVLQMQGITTEQLAGKFRDATMRIALVRQCSSRSGPQLQDNMQEAVLAYGELVLLAMCAADKQWLELNTMNMETMQRESQPEDLTAQVRNVLQLSPQQRHQLALAYKCTHSQRTSLLQQQESVVKELQVLLADGPCQDGSCSDGTCQPAADSPVSNDGPTDPQLYTQPTPSASEGSSSVHGSSGCRGFSSAYSRLHTGLLDLEVAQKADDLLQALQALQRLVRLNREVSRSMVHVWIDVLTWEQHADVALAAYPYMASVAPLCQGISKELEAAAAAPAGKRRQQKKETPT